MKRHCVVIGGGISGMSAALLLASQGMSVTLAEAALRLAPLVRGFRRRGVHFDTGFHNTGYLAPGELLDRAFRVMDIRGVESFALGLEGDQRTILDGGPNEGYPLPSGFALAQETLGDLFPKERKGLAAYLAAVRAAQESSPYLAPVGPIADEPYPNATLSQVLDELFDDVRLKSLLASQIFYHGARPDEASFVFHARAGAAPLRSLRAVAGGGEALVAAFEQALARAGVQVVTGRAVEAITVSPAGELCGVRLADKETLAADCVIATTHPALLARLTPEGVFRPVYVNRLTGRRETPRPALVFGLLPADADVRPGQFWSFLDGYDPRRWFGETPESGPDGSGVVSVMVGSSRATDGRIGFTLAACEDAGCSKDEMRARLVGRFTRVMPHLAGRAVFCDAAVGATFARFANSPSGSFYGPKHVVDCHELQARTKLRGLYLAGQAIVASGVAGAVISACVCVDVLLGTGAVRERLASC